MSCDLLTTFCREFCAKHKPIGFRDLNSKVSKVPNVLNTLIVQQRCKFPLGCDRLANYGNPAEGLARFETLRSALI